MDSAVVVGLVAVLVLILANGYFVAAEFAFVAARRTRLEQRAGSGDRRARRAVAVHKRLSFMLSGAQLGITVTSLLVGFIAEDALGGAIAPVLRAVGIPETTAPGLALTIGFVVATATQMVFGELAPKNLAIAKPEAVSRTLAGSTLAFLRVAGPIIHLFDASANRLLRAVGIEPVEELAGGVTADELALLVTASHAGGHLDADDADLLHRALEFRDLDAGAVAVPRDQVVTIDANAPLSALSELLASTGHSRFPVLDPASGQPVGVVSPRELLLVDRSRWDSTHTVEVARSLTAVPDTAAAGDVLTTLRDARSQTALVVDEHGSMAGIVTLEDLVEELVGDIRDEHDRDGDTAELVTAEGGGRWTVAGHTRLDELERVTGVALPLGDYDTVAGLVVALLGRFAERGDTVTVAPRATLHETAPVDLTVTDVDGYTLTSLLLSRPTSDGAAGVDAP